MRLGHGRHRVGPAEWVMAGAAFERGAIIVLTVWWATCSRTWCRAGMAVAGMKSPEVMISERRAKFEISCPTMIQFVAGSLTLRLITGQGLDAAGWREDTQTVGR